MAVMYQSLLITMLETVAIEEFVKNVMANIQLDCMAIVTKEVQMLRLKQKIQLEHMLHKWMYFL